MYIFKNSYAKLNVTLRVTGIRNDGYHNILSLFQRIDASEKLQVFDSGSKHDIVNSLEISIKGENIVAKALRISREYGLHVPFLDVTVHKCIPPGMGLGGGSGNAGAILDFIGAELPPNIVLKIGADVPFFHKKCEAAIVRGIGDIVDPVQKLQVNTAIIIPKWHCITGNAYKSLDVYWSQRGGYPLGEEDAKEELNKIYSLLASNKFVGFLPNDFAPRLIEENSLYEKIFKVIGETGAIAWGITGSGAAIFFLYSDSKCIPLFLERMNAYNEFISKIILA